MLRFDAPGQIAGHAARETFATDDEQHPLSASGEKHGRLPGGVATADDNYGRVAAEFCFAIGRGVVNTHPFEILAALSLDAMILGAGRDDNAFGAERSVATFDLEVGRVIALAESERERLGRRGKLRAETISLKLRAVRQVAAADAGREAEKVFDERGRSGLAARGVTLENHRLETFRCGVHRGAEPGGTCANDCQIARDFGFVLPREWPEQSGDLCHFAQGRAPQGHAAGGDQRRQIAASQAQSFAEGTALFGLRINQPVRDMVLVEEIVKLASFARTIGGENTQPGKLAIAQQTLPPHDERAHDRLTDSRQFRQRLSHPRGRHFEDLALLRLASSAAQGGCAHQHSHFTGKIARTGRGQNQFPAIPEFEHL